eukprot:IDg18825t1
MSQEDTVDALSDDKQRLLQVVREYQKATPQPSLRSLSSTVLTRIEFYLMSSLLKKELMDAFYRLGHRLASDDT